MEGGLRQSGRVSGGSRELGKPQREELAGSLLSRSGDGEGSLHGPPGPAPAALLCSKVDLCGSHSTLCPPFTRGPRGPPPTAPECRARCWGRS